MSNELDLILSPRGAGHTNAMMEGAAKTDAIVVVKDKQQERDMREKWPGVRYCTLDILDRLRGVPGPKMVDHYAMQEIVRRIVNKERRSALEEVRNWAQERADMNTIHGSTQDALFYLYVVEFLDTKIAESKA